MMDIEMVCGQRGWFDLTTVKLYTDLQNTNLWIAHISEITERTAVKLAIGTSWTQQRGVTPRNSLE